MAGVLALADELETALPGMLAEHKELVAARGDLEAAANAENKPQYARFDGKMIQHARTEEEILYSAALLIGRYVRLSLGAGESVNNLSRSEEHTSELQSLMRISYAVFCSKHKKRDSNCL